MSGGNLKLPAHVLFRKDLSLMLWKPHGVLDEVIVNEIVAFIDFAEERASKPFNRFADIIGARYGRSDWAAPASRLCAAFAGQVCLLCHEPRDRSLRQTARDAD